MNKYTKLVGLSALCIIGFILVITTYFLSNVTTIFNNEIFWLGLLISSVSTYLVIESSDYRISTKILFIFLFGVILYSPHVLSSPNNFHLYDELSHLQSTRLIDEEGSTTNIDPTLLVSKYYPALEILTLYIKNITGNSIIDSGIFVVGFSHSFMLIFLYLFFRNISTDKIAIVATFAYTFNFNYILVDTYFSYESIGITLLMLSLFFLSYRNKDNLFGVTFLQIVVLMAIVVTHHFSSYMLLLFVSVLLIIAKYRHSDINLYMKIKSFAILTGTLIFFWLIYVATVAISYYNNILKDSIKGVLEMSLFKERTTEILSEQFLNVPYYELIVRRFIYIPLILILTFVGVFYLFKRKRHNEYTYSLIIFCGLFLLSLIGLVTSSYELNRFQTFGFIGISLFVGVSLSIMQKRVILKYMSIIFAVMMIVGSVSIGFGSTYRTTYSDVLTGQQTITVDLLSSAGWFESHLGRNNSLVSDYSTDSVFDTYGNQRTISSLETGTYLFFPTSISSQLTDFLKINKVNFLVVDSRLTKFTSASRYYFDRKELYVKDHPGYGNTKTLPIGSIRKFDNSDIFLRIYDNGNINIYKDDIL